MDLPLLQATDIGFYPTAPSTSKNYALNRSQEFELRDPRNTSAINQNLPTNNQEAHIHPIASLVQN